MEICFLLIRQRTRYTRFAFRTPFVSQSADGRRDRLPGRRRHGEEGEFWSKGEFVYWIEPGPDSRLYRPDAKLGWGHLVAKLIGPADEVADRRGIEIAGE